MKHIYDNAAWFNAKVYDIMSVFFHFCDNDNKYRIMEKPRATYAQICHIERVEVNKKV